MNKLLENNQVTLVGEIKTEFEFSHEVYGEKFYRFELSVERFSGTKDVLPVVVSERLIDVNQNYTGEMMEIQGQFRSFNKHEGNRSRLLLFVFAREAKFMDKDTLPVNQILLDGFTCKQPVYRTTPNSLKAAIDILRDKNTGILQVIREIEKLYEAANEKQGIYAEYSEEWKEFDRYANALPQEAWIA